MGFIFLFIYFILFSVDTEMDRWSSFYRKRSTTSFMYVCMYVCGRSVSCQCQMSMSKTFIGGAVCREFESEAPRHLTFWSEIRMLI